MVSTEESASIWRSKIWRRLQLDKVRTKCGLPVASCTFPPQAQTRRQLFFQFGELFGDPFSVLLVEMPKYLRLVVAGGSCVGKTALIEQAVFGKHSPGQVSERSPCYNRPANPSELKIWRWTAKIWRFSENKGDFINCLHTKVTFNWYTSAVAKYKLSVRCVLCAAVTLTVSVKRRLQTRGKMKTEVIT